MKAYHPLLLFLFTLSVARAQSPDSLQHLAMQKLDWWTGEWKGTAIIQTGPGKSDTTDMMESVKYNLGGTIIQIEGVGHPLVSHIKQEAASHHAFAVLSYDLKSNRYKWQAWRIPGGIYTEYSPEVGNQSFSWSMETQQGKMRYKVILDDKGQWHETGEFSRDGDRWFPFFSMTLTRVHD